MAALKRAGMETNNVPRFTHSPLAQLESMIRLLKIKPGLLSADPIDCELVCFNIDIFYGKVSPERVLKQLQTGFETGQREKYIWADAICINQTDLAGKYAQVRLMERIYSSATTNYVDLRDIQGHEISMGYFTLQTWIIQKVALARLVKYLFRGNVFSHEQLGSILRRGSMIKNYSGKMNALQLIQLTRDFEVTDPEDRIFGLFALMSDADREAIGSYSQSVEHRRHQQGTDLPSRVPDLTTQGKLPNVVSTFRPVPYSASAAAQSRVQLVGDVIGIGGVSVCGRIVVTVSTLTCNSVHGNDDEAFACLLLMDDVYTGRNTIIYGSLITYPVATYRDELDSWREGTDAVQTYQTQARAAVRRGFALRRIGCHRWYASYLLVGDAFVHGFMYCEALERRDLRHSDIVPVRPLIL
ncbi:heterokaryon incompatibility protein 6 [Xylaria castorea]|nr:heterokaryon incompatibility protein 6 [Xylaria castorea]